jgi:hypothetical protein
MPYKPVLTWISHCKKWRKRYRGKTYYLKTPCNGRQQKYRSPEPVLCSRVILRLISMKLWSQVPNLVPSR